MIENSKELITAFYQHKLDLSADTMEAIANAQHLLEVLSSYRCTEIIDIIFENFEPFVIAKSDIPQFSNISDCFNKVPNMLVNSGLNGISFEKMGFLLRSYRRKPVADKKYGENHIKTAEMLGLCTISKVGAVRHAYKSSLTELYNGLEINIKARIEPKLCLRIPLVQNYFYSKGDDILNEMLSILSNSTQVRRRCNCNKLIEIVNHAIDYDI